MLPAIVPLSPGERPTEPRWYVVEARDGERQVVQVDPEGLAEILRQPPNLLEPATV